jgi:hypothetical protein
MGFPDRRTASSPTTANSSPYVVSSNAQYLFCQSRCLRNRWRWPSTIGRFGDIGDFCILGSTCSNCSYAADIWVETCFVLEGNFSICCMKRPELIISNNLRSASLSEITCNVFSVGKESHKLYSDRSQL